MVSQHLHPDNDIYYPFIKSMENMLQAAEKSGTVKRVVFTQAAAGLVDAEDGDTLGTRMDQALNGEYLLSYSLIDLQLTQTKNTSKSISHVYRTNHRSSLFTTLTVRPKHSV